MAEAPTRILIADDHRTFAELFAMGLEREPDLEAVGHAHTAAEAIQLTASLQPDIVIMDVRLGDEDGIEVTAQLTERYDDLCVIILTGHPDPSVVSRAARAGACGFLPKGGALAAMLHALRSARRGSLVLPPEMLELMTQSAMPPVDRRPRRPQPHPRRAGGPRAARSRPEPALDRPSHRAAGRGVPGAARQRHDQARCPLAARGRRDGQPLRADLRRHPVMDRLGRRSRPAAPSPDGAPRPDSEGVDGGSPERRSQVWRALARFALFGTIALLAVVAATVVIAERVTRGEMLRHAQRTTADVARTIITPLANEDLRAGDPKTVARLDDVMKSRMKDGSLMRVKVWSEDGTVLWSDDSRLIGRRFELEPQDAALLSTLGSTAEFTTLEREENEFEPQVGEVAEVYDGFTDRTGRPLLLELYVPVGGLDKESRAQVRTLLPLTVGGPALLLLILLPLALSMARRIDHAAAERSALLRHAVAASALERRRIAGDLHDGVVQDLAGIGYALPAIGSSLPDGPETHEARQSLEKVTEVVQRDLSALRSVITDIYPPDLNQGGLLPASQMLVSEVRYSGVEVELDVDPTVSEATLPIDTAVLAYRVLRESLRNVTRHSGATRARVALRVEDGDLVIVVADDGVGFDPDAPPPEGHFGVRLLEDTLTHVGGSLRIVSAPHQGTEVTARFPASWSSSP